MPSARFTPEYDPVFEPRTSAAAAAAAKPDDGDARGDDLLADGEATTEATGDPSVKPLNPS